jgi:hypothetical protein
MDRERAELNEDEANWNIGAEADGMLIQGSERPMVVGICPENLAICESCQRFWDSKGIPAHPVDVHCELELDCSCARSKVIFFRSRSLHLHT